MNCLLQKPNQTYTKPNFKIKGYVQWFFYQLITNVLKSQLTNPTKCNVTKFH